MSAKLDFPEPYGPVTERATSPCSRRRAAARRSITSMARPTGKYPSSTCPPPVASRSRLIDRENRGSVALNSASALITGPPMTVRCSG